MTIHRAIIVAIPFAVRPRFPRVRQTQRIPCTGGWFKMRARFRGRTCTHLGVLAGALPLQRTTAPALEALGRQLVTHRDAGHIAPSETRLSNSGAPRSAHFEWEPGQAKP